MPSHYFQAIARGVPKVMDPESADLPFLVRTSHICGLGVREIEANRCDAITLL